MFGRAHTHPIQHVRTSQHRTQLPCHHSTAVHKEDSEKKNTTSSMSPPPLVCVRLLAPSAEQCSGSSAQSFPAAWAVCELPGCCHSCRTTSHKCQKCGYTSNVRNVGTQVTNVRNVGSKSGAWLQARHRMHGACMWVWDEVAPVCSHAKQTAWHDMQLPT